MGLELKEKKNKIYVIITKALWKKEYIKHGP